MCVEKVECQSRMRCRPSAQHFNNIITNTRNVLGPGLRKGEGKTLHNCHTLCTAQIPFVVMIPKNAGVRDFMSCEQFGVFVDSSLRIGTGVAIDLVTT